MAADLHMAHPGRMARECARRIAGQHLRVIGVELHPQVRGADLLQNLSGQIEIRQEIAGHVDGVDRLDGQTLLRRPRRRPGQVSDKGGPRLGAFGLAGHDVDVTRLQHARIAQHPVEIAPEPLLPARQRGKAPDAAGIVRRRRVHRHEIQPVQDQLVAHVLRGGVIGKLHLHPVEPGIAGRGETLHQRQFGEQPGQVGSETRHHGSSAEGMIGKNCPPDQIPNQPSRCTPRSTSR